MRVVETWGDEPELATVAASCNTAEIGADGVRVSGDPTEAALLVYAQERGVDVRISARERKRRALFAFDSERKLMTTIDDERGPVAYTKGAPEEVLARCSGLTPEERAEIGARADAYAAKGLRVLALAERRLETVPDDRDAAERDLSFVGLTAMLDPPRPEVADAIDACHRAGIRVIVITGDHGLTALEVARRVGLRVDRDDVIAAERLHELSDAALDRLLAGGRELVFARSSPETKLRIADALRERGETVAMTGDGVNDAPALRRADIGVAMGLSGTEVAREAATMVLTDDNFATIVAAVKGGRRVYANIRKFVFYIFAHATPEVVPFLAFALSGGLVPLPLTVIQILAVDLGTETLPALALGQEPAENGRHGPAAPPARRRRDPPPHAHARVALPRRHLRGSRHGRVLLRPPARRLVARRSNRQRDPAPPGLPQRDDDDLPRHRGVPGRHGARGPDRSRVAPRGRLHDEQASPLGHRVRAALRGGDRRDPDRRPARDGAAALGRARVPPAVPAGRLGRRRALAGEAPPSRGPERRERIEMKRTIIMGAGGRDFHNFNVAFRDDPDTEVVAFTAAQVPGIDRRVYPPSLAGERYPQGIPIRPEGALTELIRELDVDDVVLSYSDLRHEDVMHKASTVLAAGADFRLLGPRTTMLRSTKPVVAVCAVRTGCGKSQTSRKIGRILLEAGLRVALVRHPMPYGDLEAMRVQRFAALADIDASHPTLEEREEYEEPVRMGMVMYAGVDYEAILRRAEQEADVVIWDGGNNDLPFFAPDLLIVVADALRPGHELLYHPGEANLRLADVVVINKVDTAEAHNVEQVLANVEAVNPRAQVVFAKSPPRLDSSPLDVLGKNVLVVDDGPTLTHGEMPFGAGLVAARNAGAARIVDPRPYAVGSIKEAFEKWPQLSNVLPAMGYSEEQLAELEQTINAADCDVVVTGTPIDLGRLIDSRHPIRHVRYELEEVGEPTLSDVLAPILEQAAARKGVMAG